MQGKTISRGRRNRARAGGAALLGVALITACAPPPRAESTCPVSIGSANSAAVVMLDRSASGDSAALREERIAEAMLVVDWALEHEATLTLAFFDGSAAAIDVHPCLAGSVMTAAGNNRMTRDRNREQIRDEVEAMIREGYAATAIVGGSDPLGAFDWAVDQVLTGTSEERMLVMVSSDFISNTGCLDLNALTVGEAGAIASAVRGCSVEGQIPDAAGVDVVFAGVGRVTDPTAVPTYALQWMLDLYGSVCRESGARSCRVTSRQLTQIG